MVVTKEVLDRFFAERGVKPVDLNSFYEEASPLVLVVVKKTTDLFLKEPGPRELVTAFLTFFLLCYKQRNKPLKEWVESDFERVVMTKEEKETLEANTPWVVEQVGIAYPAFMLGVEALNILAGAFFMVYTCIQMQKEITE
ncbi:MAG TPA: hypothetical protein P5023_06385 [Bacteroidales bacterium]|nr:hypothetical protein [Bacteroidales bacterium]